MNISNHEYSIDSYFTNAEKEFFEEIGLNSLNNTFKNVKTSADLDSLEDKDTLLILVEVPKDEIERKSIIEVKDIRTLNLSLYDIVSSYSQEFAKDNVGYINIYNITPLLDKTLVDETFDDVYRHYIEVVKENKQKIIIANSKKETADNRSINKEDKVNHPSHYNYGDIEVIDYIKQVSNAYKNNPYIAYCIGNVLKYVSRAPNKNGHEDLQKAQWYLSSAIDSCKEEE